MSDVPAEETRTHPDQLEPADLVDPEEIADRAHLGLEKWLDSATVSVMQALLPEVPERTSVFEALRVVLESRVRLKNRVAELEHAIHNPCDGQTCEQGGALHCHRCPEAEADQLLKQRPVQVVYVVRREGPTSELFIGFPEKADVDGWIREHRTEHWTHVTMAPLKRPEDAR